MAATGGFLAKYVSDQPVGRTASLTNVRQLISASKGALHSNVAVVIAMNTNDRRVMLPRPSHDVTHAPADIAHRPSICEGGKRCICAACADGRQALRSCRAAQEEAAQGTRLAASRRCGAGWAIHREGREQKGTTGPAQLP